MKKVTSSPSIVTIAHFRNLLESEGIPAFIKNEYLGSLVGKIPFHDAWPELWVKNDLDLDRARQLIDATTVLEESVVAPGRCKTGNEENEPKHP